MRQGHHTVVLVGEPRKWSGADPCFGTAPTPPKFGSCFLVGMSSFQLISVLKVKDTIHRLIRIQIDPEGYRGQLIRPNSTKTPRKQRNYNKVLGPCAGRLLLFPSPPAIAGRQMPPRTIGQTKPNRHKAFERAAIDTRTRARDEASAEIPSAGDAPQALTTLDADSSSTPDAAAEQSSLLLHSPAFRRTQSYLSIHKAKGQQAHLMASHRHPTPVQGIHPGNPSSTCLLMAPEQSTTNR
jgi:hypothetical protein